MSVAEVMGPLSRAVTVTGMRQALAGANALIVLNRCAVLGDNRKLDESDQLAWAVRTNLGHHTDLAEAAAARRRAATASLAANPEPDGVAVVVRQVALRPQTALLTGTGEAGIRNIGLALHGTYGWPVLRGSTLKGVTHAYARDVANLSAERRHCLFGTRPNVDPGEPGTVRFLDAVWSGPDINVDMHVLTPHVGEYYRDTTATVPPAEYFNPVPVNYLTVTAGTFVTALTGPGDDVDTAFELLKRAVDDLGVGAKTAAGYGYLTAEEAP
jgi:CRISPR-associated protein Cmr6